MTAETHPVEREQLMAYLDGELAANEAARVAAHLAECAECRQLEADLRSVSAQMLSWNVEPAPAGLIAGVNGAVRAYSLDAERQQGTKAQKTVWRRIVFSRWTWAAACACVVLLIVTKLVNRNSTPQDFMGGSAVQMSYVSPYASPQPAAPATPYKADSVDAERKTLEELMRRREESRLSSSLEVSKKDDKIANIPEGGAGGAGDASAPAVISEPSIARTASLKISVNDFAAARAAVDKIVRAHQGYAATMTINNEKGSPQSLEAELHIPAAKSDAALADLKTLGRVEQEQQGAEEVTAQVVDLDARLKNARETETRLQDILSTRTGKVSDVLDVEKEMSDVRENIERMEVEQKALTNRIVYSTITLDLHEEYKASLDNDSPSVGHRIRNAVVEGFRAAAEGLLSVFTFLLFAAPSLLITFVVLFWPVRWAIRRARKSSSAAALAR